MAQKERLNVNELVSPADTKLTFGAAAPTTGTYKLGDIVLNTAPTAGGTFAWSCTAAGTPGTWKAVALGS